MATKRQRKTQAKKKRMSAKMSPTPTQTCQFCKHADHQHFNGRHCTMVGCWCMKFDGGYNPKGTGKQGKGEGEPAELSEAELKLDEMLEKADDQTEELLKEAKKALERDLKKRKQERQEEDEEDGVEQPEEWHIDAAVKINEFWKQRLRQKAFAPTDEEVANIVKNEEMSNGKETYVQEMMKMLEKSKGIDQERVAELLGAALDILHLHDEGRVTAINTTMKARLRGAIGALWKCKVCKVERANVVVTPNGCFDNKAHEWVVG